MPAHTRGATAVSHSGPGPLLLQCAVPVRGSVLQCMELEHDWTHSTTGLDP